MLTLMVTGGGAIETKVPAVRPRSSGSLTLPLIGFTDNDDDVPLAIAREPLFGIEEDDDDEDDDEDGIIMPDRELLPSTPPAPVPPDPPEPKPKRSRRLPPPIVPPAVPSVAAGAGTAAATSELDGAPCPVRVPRSSVWKGLSEAIEAGRACLEEEEEAWSWARLG